ncbi:hypothetical protein [Rhodococcus sp. UNC23MFCrub1.1]|uniref:hypothetical protein n=1 Tax=Rhodococcus sp. UNC23MFCrub1.1 TaxID=1449068 RepID=UPI000482DB50|nr:hypothetical protein [Rhodococcus sp. UNC23MFCrub1.1]
MADDEHEQLSRQTGMVLRTAVQVAMQVAEALARRREQNLHTAAAASEARTRALAGRLNAEQRSAEAFLRRTSDRQWWATAENAQIVDAVRVAHTWKDTSPVADRAAVTIEDQLRADKGIDLTSLRDTVNTAVVAAAVGRELADRAERERQVDQNADRSALGKDDSRTTPPAQHLLLSTVGWDTAQRREQHRAELTIAGIDTEAIDFLHPRNHCLRHHRNRCGTHAAAGEHSVPRVRHLHLRRRSNLGAHQPPRRCDHRLGGIRPHTLRVQAVWDSRHEGACKLIVIDYTTPPFRHGSSVQHPAARRPHQFLDEIVDGNVR